MKTYRMKWLALPLALILVVLAGCQAVAGFDINKALLQSVKVTSSESKQSMSVELVPVNGTISAEDRKVIDLINSINLTVDSAKVQDLNRVSMKGAVGYQGKKLPFHLSMDEKGMAIQVEGAKQPIYIGLGSTMDGMPDMTAYRGQIQQLSEKAIEFVLKHLPNPSQISVKKAQETVNGEAVDLTHLQLEIRGDELITLVKPFLTSVAKDEQGIKDLIGSFYDILYPMLKEMGGDLGATGFLPESKEATVAALAAALQEELNKWLNNYDRGLKDLMAETPGLSTVFGKDTVLKLDIYFDDKLNIRKENAELTVALPAAEDLPIQAVKLRMNSEMWNIGGAVNTEPVNTSAGVLDVMQGDVTPGQFLRNFDSNSEIYKLLKDEMKITNKQIFIDPFNEYYGVTSKNNTSFIPLRYLSEQLDAQVKWDNSTNQIVITDDITGGQIIVKVGAKQAKVNGQTVNLDQPAFVDTYGTTYVPLRFIAESLGAKVTVDGEGFITIERP